GRVAGVGATGVAGRTEPAALRRQCLIARDRHRLAETAGGTRKASHPRRADSAARRRTLLARDGLGACARCRRDENDRDQRSPEYDVMNSWWRHSTSRERTRELLRALRRLQHHEVSRDL